MTSPRPTRGAVAVREPRKKPLGWLLPVALILLLGLVAISALVLLNANDEGDDPGLDVTDDPQAQTAEDPNTAADSGSANDGSSAPQGTNDSTSSMADAVPGTLTADGTALLPEPSDGYQALDGASGKGEGLTVESVVADEGFWVGSSPRDRFFIYLSEQARSAQGESPFQVKAGQKINVEGVVTAIPGDVATFGVDDDEGAVQLREQGFYLEATKVALG
jgi:hypothetical protein